MDKLLKLLTHFAPMIEYYCRSEERSMFLKRQTPERKYELLMENDPQLKIKKETSGPPGQK